MKKMSALVLAATVSATLILSGCDWTTGGGVDDFSTRGISVNFSGVYHGNMAGGRAVSATSGGRITRFVIHQAGNTLQVTDNNGSTYDGKIGSPAAVSAPDGGVYPAGATLVQGQVNFSGHDNAAGRDIEFVGVIHVVAVEDIYSEEFEETDADGVTVSRSFEIDSSNAKYRLEGNWMEVGGRHSSVDAISSGSTGTILF